MSRLNTVPQEMRKLEQLKQLAKCPEAARFLDSHVSGVVVTDGHKQTHNRPNTACRVPTFVPVPSCYYCSGWVECRVASDVRL
jgi:hypothetical protein